MLYMCIEFKACECNFVTAKIFNSIYIWFYFLFFFFFSYTVSHTFFSYQNSRPVPVLINKVSTMIEFLYDLYAIPLPITFLWARYFGISNASQKMVNINFNTFERRNIGWAHRCPISITRQFCILSSISMCFLLCRFFFIHFFFAVS